MTRIECLDHGYVALVHYLGDENFICESARVSTGFDPGDPERNAKLIKFLVKHMHTSPLEMAEVVFDLKMPIFVARQFLRHRTAHPQEFSQRYSEVDSQFYLPGIDNINFQGKTNRQVSGGKMPANQAASLRNRMLHACTAAFHLYHDLLACGMSREQARIILPLNTYTVIRWKCDLHNTMKMLKLRLAEDAQFEIRTYAEAMASLVRDRFPNVCETFLGPGKAHNPNKRICAECRGEIVDDCTITPHGYYHSTCLVGMRQ